MIRQRASSPWSNLQTAQKQLENLQKEARDKYGTDDLQELKTKLQEMEAENERKRAEYQQSLDSIEQELDEVDQKYSNESAAADKE